MFYAYVIKSVDVDFLYKGHCENPEERLKQHNAGYTKSLKPYIPFKLVYCEKFGTREEAIVREKYFKSAAGRRFLKTTKLLKIKLIIHLTAKMLATNLPGR